MLHRKRLDIEHYPANTDDAKTIVIRRSHEVVRLTQQLAQRTEYRMNVAPLHRWSRLCHLEGLAPRVSSAREIGEPRIRSAARCPERSAPWTVAGSRP
ncbi:hypothetical protein, partial [Streptomyces sp. NRRL S-813]|uniref:hypothetical protein n=1 Tax=Streptomyces sp. NRRL S-813 TaxID=1463919 RepID=UPI001F420068